MYKTYRNKKQTNMSSTHSMSKLQLKITLKENTGYWLKKNKDTGYRLQLKKKDTIEINVKRKYWLLVTIVKKKIQLK